MKIEKIKSLNNMSMYGIKSHRVRIKDNCNNSIQQKNRQNIERPAQCESIGGSECLIKDNVSFAGDPKLVTKLTKEVLQSGENLKISSLAQKVGSANWFKGVLNSVQKNETFYEAMTALVVAGMLKPACVLAMPGAEKEDKEMSATKNAVSAFVGFGISNLILGPFSTAVNKITESLNGKNPTKYIKDMDYVKALKSEELQTGLKSTLGDAFKTTYKKFPDIGVAPLKAGITIALTPYILKFLFHKDKKKENKQIESPLKQMTVMNSIRMDSNKKEDKIKNPSFKGLNKDDAPHFKGGVSQIIEITQDIPKKTNIVSKAKTAYCETLSKPIAKFIGKISTTNPAKKVVETSAHFDKVSARWSDMASFAITYFYINNTRKSDKIEEDRKLPLMINNFMVTVASSTAAFLIDKYTDKPTEQLFKSYVKNRECEIFDKSNQNIVKTLEYALEGKKDSSDIKNLMNHSDDLLSEGAEKLTSNLKDAVNALKNNGIVKEAISKNIINSDDLTKIAVSGFEKQAQNIYKNISKAKSLTVFTITVRFLVTVLMTPVIGRVVAMVNKKLRKDGKKNIENNNASVPVAGSETLGIKDYMNSLNK